LVCQDEFFVKKNPLDVKERDEHALDLSHQFLDLNVSTSILMNKLLKFRYSFGHCGADGPTYVLVILNGCSTGAPLMAAGELSRPAI
jgi:hypothetical protein